MKGCQEDIDPRADSPTASKDSMKIFLTIAANEGYEIRSLDVTSAFLQGHPLERDVFIKPPLERRKEGIIWKLKKSCYRLCDASRQWFIAVKEQLCQLKMKSLSGDDAFFYLLEENKKLMGLCILHVDNFLIGGTNKFLHIIHDKLKGRFTFRKIEIESFKFTGLNIQQDEDGIYVDQNEYIQQIEPVIIEKNCNNDSPLPPKKFKEYRALTGKLSWASENSRPDISFDAREMSTKNTEATFADLKYANKVLRKAQQEKNVTIKFSWLGDVNKLMVVCFSDSSYRNVESRIKSVGEVGSYSEKLPIISLFWVII